MKKEFKYCGRRSPVMELIKDGTEKKEE